MMLWREQNEIFPVPTYEIRPRSIDAFAGDDSQFAWEDATISDLSPPPASVSSSPSNVKDSVALPEWDVLLQDMKTAARDMHQTRKWRFRGRKNAAGWCQWGTGKRLKERGEFVEESEVGYEVERAVDDKTWAIKLGYRRDDAVVDELDLDEEDGGEAAAVDTQRTAHNGDVETTMAGLSSPGQESRHQC